MPDRLARNIALPTRPADRSIHRQRRTAGVLSAALAAVVLIAVTLTGCGSSSGKQTAAGSGTPAVAAPGTTASSAPPPTPTATPTTVAAAAIRQQAETQLAAAMKPIPAGGVSVGAYNMSTGASYTAGQTSGMWTASMYKLFVLEALLIEAQNNGTQLSAGNAQTAVPMIEQSDNTAGWELFEAAGQNAGLSSAWSQLGLHHTVPGTGDPTFTETEAADCLTVLKNLLNPKGPLNGYSRGFALNLMRNVESDQRWGVGVVSDKGYDFANKNGWLSVDNTNAPGDNDNGLWIVNSMGVVQVGGQQILMAVMTRHNSDFDSGVALVQSLAKLLAKIVRP